MSDCPKRPSAPQFLVSAVHDPLTSFVGLIVSLGLTFAFCSTIDSCDFVRFCEFHAASHNLG